MRVGEQEGMQHFDGDIERLIRNGTLDMETGLAYATNPGNLQLEMSDLRLDAEDEAKIEADSLLEVEATEK
jgi:twitching motility protein PilT